MSATSKYPLRALAIGAIALLASACGGTAPTTVPTGTAQPTNAPTFTSAPLPSPSASPSATPVPTETPAAATLLLEVTNEGGFIAPSAHLGQPPMVVVDTAGDIYTADPNATAASLVPPVVVRNVGTSGAAEILAAIRAAGLDQAGDGGGVVTDAGVMVFRADIDGEEIVNRIADSGGPVGPGHPGASPNPAIDLLNRLLDPAETWGAADVAPAAFAPTAYKIYVAPVSGAGSSFVDWPLDSLSDFGSPATPDFGVTGLRTGVVAGTDAGTLAGALGAAPSDTNVTSDGNHYQVWIRPLLPPEIAQ